ncbi:hypothetical protein MRX96_037196 [Rhipicephalus microplus]
MKYCVLKRQQHESRPDHWEEESMSDDFVDAQSKDATLVKPASTPDRATSDEQPTQTQHEHPNGSSTETPSRFSSLVGSIKTRHNCWASMTFEKRQTPDDQVPITRGVAESTALISSATTATDTSDSTPNANLVMSSTLKNMNATSSTSMKQLRSRPPTQSEPVDTEVSTELARSADASSLLCSQCRSKQGSGSSGSDSAKQGTFEKPRVGSPPRQTSPTVSDDDTYI